jgi:hypothetical protein
VALLQALTHANADGRILIRSGGGADGDGGGQLRFVLLNPAIAITPLLREVRPFPSRVTRPSERLLLAVLAFARTHPPTPVACCVNQSTASASVRQNGSGGCVPMRFTERAAAA